MRRRDVARLETGRRGRRGVTRGVASFAPFARFPRRASLLRRDDVDEECLGLAIQAFDAL